MNRYTLCLSRRMDSRIGICLRGRLATPPHTVANCSHSTQTATTTTPAPRPKPPMPRVLPHVLGSTNTTTTSHAPKERRVVNPIMLGIGSLILGLLVVDNVLQYLDASAAQQQIAQLAKEEEETRQGLLEEWKDRPALFVAKVIIQYKMGGTMGLRDTVAVGDVVEIVQENVGPNQGYNLCRTRTAEGDVSAVGWYPKSFVEPIPVAPAKRVKFLGLF